MVMIGMGLFAGFLCVWSMVFGGPVGWCVLGVCGTVFGLVIYMKTPKHRGSRTGVSLILDGTVNRISLRARRVYPMGEPGTVRWPGPVTRTDGHASAGIEFQVRPWSRRPVFFL